ncbi:hypothetical protein CC2G_005801 [Coprinopsis cinerea AmutBmut pab1-1]|nr:hypothetical protein CC2G_005801 [Coprinopsis cinerea AmutBmut pab1-1]
MATFRRRSDRTVSHYTVYTYRKAMGQPANFPPSRTQSRALWASTIFTPHRGNLSRTECSGGEDLKRSQGTTRGGAINGLGVKKAGIAIKLFAKGFAMNGAVGGRVYTRRSDVRDRHLGIVIP